MYVAESVVCFHTYINTYEYLLFSLSLLLLPRCEDKAIYLLCWAIKTYCRRLFVVIHSPCLSAPSFTSPPITRAGNRHTPN